MHIPQYTVEAVWMFSSAYVWFLNVSLTLLRSKLVDVLIFHVTTVDAVVACFSVKKCLQDSSLDHFPVLQLFVFFCVCVCVVSISFPFHGMSKTLFISAATSLTCLSASQPPALFFLYHHILL